MEEEGIGEVTLFHTRCVVNERRVNLTIDESTAVNMVSIEVVEKLGLKMAPLERPYTLKWFKGEIKITHQILLIFDLGKYCCAEFFHVCPVSMVSCHLLLGDPWCKRVGAVRDVKKNSYSLSRKGKQICFIPMPMDVFAADWKDRLRKRREEVEEIKEEVDAPMKGLNLLVKKVQEDGDPKGQRWSVFKTQCKINKSCLQVDN